MASLGQLVIELAANTARLQSDLGKAVGVVERTAAKFKTAFKFAGGGLLGAAFASAAKQAIEFGDSINKASIKSGIGNRAMSELAYAAKLADVDIASLSTAIKKMQVSLSEAGTGAKAPILALSALGLTIGEVQKRKPEAQFELLADRISKLTDPADRARAAVELFGKAGADLLPLFEQGAAGIAKARAEAEKLGLSFSDNQIKALSAADDSIKRLDASWKGFATTLTAAVAPALSNIFDKLSGMDTRGIDQKIDDLEAKLRRIGFGGLAGRSADDPVRVAAESELAALRGRKELEDIRAAQTGTSGGPQSRGRTGFAIGFGAADAAAKAEEAATKAAAADLKAREKWARDVEAVNKNLNDQLDADNHDKNEREWDRFLRNDERIREAQEESAERLRKFNDSQADHIFENVQKFKEGFLNAWDDMVNNGKFRWDELLKYMLAQFAKAGIAKLFDSVFSPTGGKNSAGGWLSKGLDWLGGLFGGGRASGGGVQAGKFYEVGERGREIFAPGMSGSIIPNHALAGGGGINMTYNIDARGAGPEFMRLLPSILKSHKEDVIATVDDRLKRRKIGVR